MKTKTLLIPIIGTLLALCACAAYADLPGLKRNFTYKQVGDAVEVYRDGKLFTRYITKDTPLPYLYPLSTPSGIAVTREFPMKNVPQNQQDHPHHRSLWLGLDNVNGANLWSSDDRSGKIKQSKLDFQGTPGYWGIHATNYWVGPDDKTLCCEERRISFLSCDYGTVISTMITLTACEGQLKLGGSKEGFFALRMAPGLQLKDGTGHILNSEGKADDACWGQRAKWCDYTGQLNGKTVGVTMFDSPWNYGHPTYWHVRDYGLFAANPFGGKDFTSDAKNDSTLTLEPGETTMFIYGVLIHDGKLDAATLNKLSEQIVGRGPDKSTQPGTDRKLIQQPTPKVVKKPAVETKPAVAPGTPVSPKQPAPAKAIAQPNPPAEAKPAVTPQPPTPVINKPAAPAKAAVDAEAQAKPVKTVTSKPKPATNAKAVKAKAKPGAKTQPVAKTKAAGKKKPAATKKSAAETTQTP